MRDEHVDIPPKVQETLNKIAREIICDSSYFTDEDDDSILKLIDCDDDEEIMENEERERTVDIAVGIVKEVFEAIEAYEKAVAKKLTDRDKEENHG